MSARAKQPELSHADVAAAISRFLGAPSNSAAVAAIASRINVKGIQLAPGGDLAQSGDFQSRILAAGGNELAQITDPSRLAQILQDQAQRANVTSAEGARLGHVLEKLSGLRSSGSDGSDGGNSGYRLRDLPDSTRMDRVMLDAQAIALKTPGLEWAAHHPDLLRLGPAAMETFAKMKFERDSYLALSRDAGASAKEIHAFVHAAKEAKVKPEELNDLAKKFGATSQGLTPEEQKRRMDQMTEWMTLLGKDPAKAAAKMEEMRKERDELVKRHPDKASAASAEEKAQQEIQKRIELERKAEAAKVSATAIDTNTNAAKASEQVKADVQVQAGNDKLAALLGKPAASATPAAATPGTTPPSPPVAPETGKANPITPTPAAAAPKPG